MLMTDPVLKIARYDRPFTLRTDASSVALGAVLLQEHGGHLFPVAYASRKMLDREVNYHITEKECLAIVWAIQKFQKYLYGTSFILETDHSCLKYLEKSKFVNSRLMRWALALQPYQFEVQVIRGQKNIGADYLSRME